jgi:pyruvate kinase
LKTKIIATVGPKTESEEMLEKLVINGMNIARVNFSHCTTDQYQGWKDRIQTAGKKYNKNIKILQDLQGPRIRVGKMPDEGLILNIGDTVRLSTEKDCPAGRIHVDDPYLHMDIKVGDPIYLVNGNIELITREVEKKEIIARVVRSGVLFSRKAVNVPHTKLTATGPTEKDIEDVKCALEVGVDFIAVSFVQTAKDIERLKEVVKDKAKIIAKIETAMALKHMDEIIRASDGIMIARGDLGIEVPIEQVPYAQKNLIRHAAWHNKASIVATQMLYSMITNPHPSRAEVSDVANAVWEGATAVMLSDETAAGNYPIEAIQTMVRIVKHAENSRYEQAELL